MSQNDGVEHWVWKRVLGQNELVLTLAYPLINASTSNAREQNLSLLVKVRSDESEKELGSQRMGVEFEGRIYKGRWSKEIKTCRKDNTLYIK